MLGVIFVVLYEATEVQGGSHPPPCPKIKAIVLGVKINPCYNDRNYPPCGSFYVFFFEVSLFHVEHVWK